MMRSLLMVTAALVMATAVTASAQTPIDDIQLYDNLGNPTSPFDTQVVTVRGVLTTNRGTFNGGTHYVEDLTGGITVFDSASPTLAVGDTVEVTGTVGVFSGEIQLTNSPTWTFVNSGPDPIIAAVDLADVLDNPNEGIQGSLDSADFELVGSLISSIGTIDTITPGFNTTITMVGVPGDTLTVFIDGTTGIDVSAVDIGDTYLFAGPLVNFNTLREIKPRFQSDVVENPTDPFPQIADVTPNPWTPQASDPVTVTAEITDDGGSISSATLYYKATSAGVYSSTAMNNTVGDTYSATIPAPHDPSGIDYYVEAVDNSAQTTELPNPASPAQLAVGFTSIVDIQSNLAAGSDASALVGQLVNIDGIVTLAPGELNATGSQWCIEEPTGGPWSGVFIFEGAGANLLFRGDRVRISGVVGEFTGTTQVLPQRSDAVELVSFGNPEPPVIAQTTTQLDTTEAWENVLARTYATTVIDTTNNLFNEFTVQDHSDSTLLIDPLFAVTSHPEPGDIVFVKGWVDGRFELAQGGLDLVPREDGEIMVNTITAVDDDAPGRAPHRLYEAYPNPFNPTTNIKFELPVKGMAELAIFDQQGRRVTTLTRGELDAGEHTLQWNGLDSSDKPVSSGVYYARLRYGKSAPQIAKLTLVK